VGRVNARKESGTDLSQLGGSGKQTREARGDSLFRDEETQKSEPGRKIAPPLRNNE